MKVVQAGVLALLLLTVGMMGCVKEDPDFESPVSAIPKLLVDHYEGKTKVYISGLDDHRYTSISIRIFKGNTSYAEVSDEQVYSLYLSTNRTDFTLNITVQDKKESYAIQANFTLWPPDDPNLIFLIHIDEKDGKAREKKVNESDLPWRTLLDRVK